MAATENEEKKVKGYKYIYLKGHHINIEYITDWYHEYKDGKTYLIIHLVGMTNPLQVEVNTNEQMKFGEVFKDSFDQLVYLS